MSTVLDTETENAVHFDSIEFLRQLVAIQSHSGEESDAANFIVKTMKEIGFDEAFVDDAGNAVGSRSCPNDAGQTTKHVVLLGHMDTVKGEIEVRIEGDCLYGRGSVDAKGPLATFVASVAQAQLQPGTKVTVIGAVEEESSTSRGARFAATQYRPDLCIIGEPSGWDGITIGYKGIVQIAYLLEKPMGHASGLQSAVPEKAIEFWNRITQFCDTYNKGRDKLFAQLIPAIRDFNFNSDGLYDRVRLHASVRLPPGFNIAEFEKFVGEFDDDAEIKTYGYEVAFRSDRSNELARALNIAIRKHDGKPRFKVKTGTCDMNVVGPAWECPIVAYGPGDSSLDHTPNEHIKLSEYAEAISVLTQVVSGL